MFYFLSGTPAGTTVVFFPNIVFSEEENNRYFPLMEPDSTWKSPRDSFGTFGGSTGTAFSLASFRYDNGSGSSRCRTIGRRNFHRGTHGDEVVCRACANPRAKLHKRGASAAWNVEVIQAAGPERLSRRAAGFLRLRGKILASELRGEVLTLGWKK